MSAASKPVTPKPETAKLENPDPVTPKRVTSAQSDHEHVGKISTQTTIFVLIAIALIFYEIQWILPPFVLAGVLAYATTPAISIDQLFGPLVLGAAARLHPVLVIFCFLSGGLLFGVVGVILAGPMALVVKTTLTVLYDEPV